MTKLILCFFLLSKKKNAPFTFWYWNNTLNCVDFVVSETNPIPLSLSFQINLKLFFFLPFRKTFFTYDIAATLFFPAIEIKEWYTRETHGFGQPLNFSFRILQANVSLRYCQYSASKHPNTTLTRGGGLDGYVQLNRVYTRSSQSIKIDSNQVIFIDW